MEDNDRAAKDGRRPQEDVPGLVERCQRMENELNEIKQAVLQLQRQLEKQLGKETKPKT